MHANKRYIVTHHHAAANASEITITLLDNRTFSAKVIGSDEGADIAVLQAKQPNLTAMSLGDSAKLEAGDYVVAIGNPFGLAHTVTAGIVSALGRTGINSQAYEDFIQTDASINPGNSGGALVNLSGELVGINSEILSRSGGNIGIGFAIPVNMVRSIMDQLVTNGSVQRGLLGVRLDDLTPNLAARYGLHDNSGALVNTVTANSAAEKAGIQIDDVIVSVNGTHIRDSGSLKAMIGLLRPGEQVRVGLIRDGREQTVTAVLGELTAAAAAAAAAEEPDQREGFAQLDPTFEGAEILENEQGKGVPGLIVARVVAGSPAFQQGLRQGDVITTINRVPVRTLADAAGAIKGAGSIVLRVRRGNRDQLILMR